MEIVLEHVPYNRNEMLSVLGDRITTGIEVGVYRGGYARDILFRTDVNPLYLVDTWNNDGMSNPVESPYSDMLSNISDYADRAVIMKGWSIDMAKEFMDRSIDFVYIDGDHSYEGALADLASYWPKVKLDGIIAGHDFPNHRSKRVKKAIKHYIHSQYNRDGVLSYATIDRLKIMVTKERAPSWFIDLRELQES
jgi:hypothetical protein